MRKKKTTYEFIEASKVVHGDKYDYSLSEYVGNKIKLDIICPIHGKFTQSPHHHIRGIGCNECGRNKTIQSRLLSDEKVINEFREVHGDRYDYSAVNYVNDKTKIKIICSVHGEFEQTPCGHKAGKGCQKCKYEKVGWSYGLWELAAKTSNNFDDFKVYIIECWDEHERFYKIGKTFNQLNVRFSGKSTLPYEWTVVDIIIGSSKEISNLENTLKNNNNCYSYLPKKRFGGMYECYSKVIY